MGQTIASPLHLGLERLCATPGGDGIIAAPGYPGIERLEARFRGDVFEPHRHDTYGLGLTLGGVQAFRYRGEQRYSLPGQVIILHPDEVHDGGAATEEGLTYRMLYLEPSMLLGATRLGLPFVDDPVVSDNGLAALLHEAFGSLDGVLEELFVDDFLARLAPSLARHATQPAKSLGVIARNQVAAARDYLEAHATRAVRSEELERLTGLDRFALSRHFRAAFATSPHRFLLMRRLQIARSLIAEGSPLADAAAATGFSDQSHMSRHFKKTFGMAPGAWAGMLGQGRRPGSEGP